MDFTDYLGRAYDEYNCWTIVRSIFADMKNIELDSDIYKASIDFVEIWYDSGQEIRPEILMPYDILSMRRYRPYIEHVGLVVDAGRFLHARPRTGVVIEPISRWAHKVVQVARHKYLQ